jgi:hypothetical protein
LIAKVSMVFFNLWWHSCLVVLFNVMMVLMFDDEETIEEQLESLKHQENKNASKMILCILFLFVYSFKLRLNPLIINMINFMFFKYCCVDQSFIIYKWWCSSLACCKFKKKGKNVVSYSPLEIRQRRPRQPN